jgi:hypothetical protein
MSAVALAVALAMGLVSPACAAGKHKKRAHHHRMAPQVQYGSYGYGAPHWGGGASGTGPLYNGQDYLGTDPDPGIRFQIMRDLAARYGGGAD